MLTQYIAKDHTKMFRVIFGAFIASLIVPIAIYFPNTLLSTFIGKLLYSFLIIICAFRIKSFAQFGKLLLIFYFMTFAVGGGLIGVHFLVNNPIVIAPNGVLSFHSGYGDPVSWLFIVIGFPLIWLFTKRRMDKHTIEQIRYDQIYPVTIQIAKMSFSTNGYVDSGNQLVDPLTKKPVIICDEPFLKQWFSSDDWFMMKTAHEQLNFDELPEEWEEKIHIVPYQGVEGKSSFLFAIRPDKLTIYDGEQKIIAKDILIGIQFATLTKDQRFNCLLQPQILQFIRSTA